MPMLVMLEERDGYYAAGRTLRASDLVDSLGQENNPEWKTVAFDEKGAISGQAGCNRLLGQVRQDGLRVDFSNLGSTMKLCAPQFMKVERTFIDFLGRAAFVTASTAVPGGIDLWDKAGERIVTLVPEKAGKCD